MGVYLQYLHEFSKNIPKYLILLVHKTPTPTIIAVAIVLQTCLYNYNNFIEKSEFWYRHINLVVLRKMLTVELYVESVFIFMIITSGLLHVLTQFQPENRTTASSAKQVIFP